MTRRKRHKTLKGNWTKDKYREFVKVKGIQATFKSQKGAIFNVTEIEVKYLAYRILWQLSCQHNINEDVMK